MLGVVEMILEEETYEKFGYYPSELTPQSGKKIVVQCDDRKEAREIVKYAYRALCKHCSAKGERNPNVGKQMSIKQKKRMGASLMCIT